LERAEAKKRQQGSRAKKGQRVGAPQRGGNLPPPKAGKTRDKVGKVVGMSGKTYEKAKKVVEAAEAEPEKFGDLPEKMDQDGKVDAAFKEMKERRGRKPKQAEPEPTPAADPPAPGLVYNPEPVEELLGRLDKIAQTDSGRMKPADVRAIAFGLRDRVTEVQGMLKEILAELKKSMAAMSTSFLMERAAMIDRALSGPKKGKAKK
jgi:hypothetical protein